MGAEITIPVELLTAGTLVALGGLFLLGIAFVFMFILWRNADKARQGETGISPKTMVSLIEQITTMSTDDDQYREYLLEQGQQEGKEEIIEEIVYYLPFLGAALRIYEDWYNGLSEKERKSKSLPDVPYKIAVGLAMAIESVIISIRYLRTEVVSPPDEEMMLLLFLINVFNIKDEEAPPEDSDDNDTGEPDGGDDDDKPEGSAE